tara:strand:- start:2930 stop:4504 length:1575 start_codon:yes stop_codon:yes gene_type:complete
MERRVTAAFNKRLEIVTQELRLGLEPELGVMTGPLRNELEAVFSAHVKRVFTTVYEYNNDRYKNLDTKADGDASFGMGFGNSAEFDSLIAQYLQGRRSFLSNMSQGYGRSIIKDVLQLREDGQNLQQISKQIRTKYRGINKSRAATIARTETHGATGAAQDSYHRSVANNYGIIMKKQWVSTSDARTRRNHSAMNGTIIEMEEDFLMPDGARMSHVGDSKGGAANVVNCRCVILYVDADDEVDDPKAPDVVEDIPENEEGLRVDKNGRPVGISEAEFFRRAEGLSMRDLAKDAHKSMNTRVGQAMSGRWSEAGWKGFKFESIYGGRKIDDYGRAGGALKAKGADSLAYARGVAFLGEIHKEIDQLADTFLIPRTRGFKATRGKSIANMGDAVMGWNKKWIAHFGMAKKDAPHPWKKGDPVSERPFNAISYFEDRMDQMRCVAFHEFGHQVHQLFGLNKGLGSYRRPAVESEIYGKRLGGPSRYSQSNSREWFAENFAVWAMRRDDLVAPEFLEIIEDLLRRANG